MANIPTPKLYFEASCRDCGYRQVKLPDPMPLIGDDFDWLTRDYDGFRLFMMEELAGRFPERKNWTPADIEVILVEALAVVLDQQSDALDRMHNEAFLDSARRPDSVRRLLKLIGYDAVYQHYEPSWSSAALVQHLLSYKGIVSDEFDFSLDLTQSTNLQKLLLELGKPKDFLGTRPNINAPKVQAQLFDLIGYHEVTSLVEAVDLDIPEHRLFATQQLEKQWRDNAHKMDTARARGPRELHTNRRMVTLDDYRERLEDHPAVLRAASTQKWQGSWNTILVTAVLASNANMDEKVESVLSAIALDEFKLQTNQFHRVNQLAPIDWSASLTFRSVLKALVEKFRMVGQEVWLQDATPVGVSIALSIRVADNYFRSEIQQSIKRAMSNEPEGFFEPGRLAFGANLYASDLIEWLMSIEGIEAVCLNQFKRVGKRFADQSGAGVIRLSGEQIARCDNDAKRPAMGFWRMNLHGGQRG
tara:strand:- start:1906 stop:3327 length:1422 start_codon:yes stop_codon:yes gene_type:complete